MKPPPDAIMPGPQAPHQSLRQTFPPLWFVRTAEMIRAQCQQLRCGLRCDVVAVHCERHPKGLLLCSFGPSEIA